MLKITGRPRQQRGEMMEMCCSVTLGNDDIEWEECLIVLYESPIIGTLNKPGDWNPQEFFPLAIKRLRDLYPEKDFSFVPLSQKQTSPDATFDLHSLMFAEKQEFPFPKQ